MKHGQHIAPAAKFAVAVACVAALGIPLLAAATPDTSGIYHSSGEGGSVPVVRLGGGGLQYIKAPPVKRFELAEDDAVVPPVKRVKPKTPDEAPEDAPADTTARDTAKPHDVGAESRSDLGVVGRVQDWLARANREFQTTVIPRLSKPVGEGDDAIAHKLDEVKQEDIEQAAKNAEEAMKAAEAKKAGERRQAEEAKRKAEEEKKAAEAAKSTPPAPAAQPDDSARLAEEMKKERERIEAEAARAEERRKAAEAQRQAEEAQRHAEEEQRRAEEEKRRNEERAAAAAREAEAERARAAAEEAARNRTRTVVLTVEPLRRAARDRDIDADYRPSSYRHEAAYRSYHYARGPMVRRWLWRTRGRCWHAGRRIRLPGFYTVGSGDTLWLISKRHYRRGWLWHRIYRINRHRIRNPYSIYPCQRIFLPRHL